MAGVKCTDCRMCRLKDHGYSNYTVEGTTFECLINKHPDGSFDRWYGEDYRLHYANWCSNFEEGKLIHISVEGDVK